MKVVLSIPTYGHVDPQCARSVRAAVMTAANHGTQWVGDYSTDRLSYGTGRNLVARTIIEEVDVPVDGIVWIDSDMIVPVDAIWRLLATVEKNSFDFLTGIYHQRGGEHLPVVYIHNPKTDRFNQASMYPEKSIVKLDACGFGFVYTSVSMLEKMKAHPDFKDDGGEWFPDYREGHGKYGEDIGFCRLAMKAGIQLYADSNILLGHCGEPVVVTRELYMDKLTGGKDLKKVQLM
jgi:hypothetical protein